MKNSKYYFNPENLTFEKVELKLKDYIRQIIPYLSLNIIFALIFLIIGLMYFETPYDKYLHQERSAYLINYEILNHHYESLKKTIEEIHERDNFLYRPVFNAKLIPEQVFLAGIGGSEKHKNLKGLPFSNQMIETTTLSELITRQMYIQSTSFSELVDLIQNKEKMLKCIPNIRPVKLEDITGVCTFGMRVQPILKIYRMHKGVDLCAPSGTEIYAAGDGTVINNEFHYSLGNYISINHGYGFRSVYGHLLKSFVKLGQKVKRGDLIALMGTTGISQVDHLHYEIYKNGVEENPMKYFYEDLTDVEFQSLIRNNTEAESLRLK